MDTKIEIKEDDPLSDNIASLEFYSKNGAMKANTDNVLLNNDCKIIIKTEIKSETPLLEFCSQNEREFLPKDAVMNTEKCNNDHEVHNKIEIKEEPWWQEAETSHVCDDIKDDDSPATKSPRLCREALTGNKSLKPSSEVSGKGTSIYNGRTHPKSDVTETPNAEEHLHSKQSSNCSVGGALYLKQNNLVPKSERSHKLNICKRNFTDVSHLKSDDFIHINEKRHKCQTCKKNFTRLASLKVHNMIHDGKKPHKCKSCDKSYSQFSHLKVHNLFHEGKRPHNCKTCDKNFTLLSHLKRHTLIHEGKRPHKCITCDKRFTQLTDLRKHTLIHDGIRPHKCDICEKSFTAISDLKRHCSIHDGKKRHKCEICDKRFTRLYNLKRHNLIH